MVGAISQSRADILSARKLRNRESAKRSREKKRTQHEATSEELEQQRRLNANLLHELEELRKPQSERETFLLRQIASLKLEKEQLQEQLQSYSRQDTWMVAEDVSGDFASRSSSVSPNSSSSNQYNNFTDDESVGDSPVNPTDFGLTLTPSGSDDMLQEYSEEDPVQFQMSELPGHFQDHLEDRLQDQLEDQLQDQLQIQLDQHQQQQQFHQQQLNFDPDLMLQFDNNNNNNNNTIFTSSTDSVSDSSSSFSMNSSIHLTPAVCMLISLQLVLVRMLITGVATTQMMVPMMMTLVQPLVSKSAVATEAMMIKSLPLGSEEVVGGVT